MTRSPPPAPSAGDAFPRGTYAKYKRATSYFLQWLLRAHSAGLGADAATPARSEDVTGKRQLDLYEQIVAAVAADPTALPPALLMRLPRALEACESAITLRARVAVFFGDAADDAHAHFLSRLTAWSQTLKSVVFTPVQVGTPQKPELDFSNYYDVLALPDDYFTDNKRDEDEANTNGSTRLFAVPALSKAERKRLQDEVLGTDLYAELACMFMELDELSEAVYSAFHDVKCEKKTLLEAAVVLKVAIDSAVSVIANFQLCHPTIRDAEDLASFVKDHISFDQITRLVSTVKLAWQPTDDVRYQYVPGTVLVDVVGITQTLKVFGNRFRSKGVKLFDFSDPIFDVAAYNEEAYQDSVVPDWSSMSSFFVHCLPRLVSTLANVNEVGGRLVPDSLEAWLLEPFDKLVKTGQVTIHLVFVCTCWVRSVAALQGKRDLARTISASFMHMSDLEERLAHSSLGNVGSGVVPEEIESQQQKITSTSFLAPAIRTNPLLAACVMLDHQMRFLTLGSDALLMSLFRALSHIYSALRDRRLLDGIPFLENVIQVYETSVFAPSRVTATRGSFARSFLASHSLMETTVALRYGLETTTKPGHARSVIEKGRFVNISRVAQLIEKNDYSVLPSETTASWKSLLAAVSALCREDLFVSRTLSRDTLRFSTDVKQLCEKLCDELGRRPHYDRMVAASTSPARALETAIVFPLLPVLDSLEERDIAELASNTASSVRGEALLEAVSGGTTRSSLMFGLRAAIVITSHFGQQPWVERTYFTFPPTPAWISIQFGSSSSAGENGSSLAVEDEFKSLYKMLATSQGPLRGESLDDFKRRVIAKPSVLSMMSSDPTEELCSLFHLAAAGPAHDLHLVEWLIQMGALDHEPIHFRHPEHFERLESPRSMCNALAVHCAAKRGLRTIVQHILVAENFRNLNTRTYHSKEWLALLAVKAGDQPLWAWLCLYGAKNIGVDATGKKLWECAKDKKWRAELKEYARIEEWRAEYFSTKSADASELTDRLVQRAGRDADTEAMEARHEVMKRYAYAVGEPAPVPPVPVPSPDPNGSGQPSTDTSEDSRMTGSKKKNKKNKKSKKSKKSPRSEVPTASVDSEVATTTRLMSQLFDTESRNAAGAEVQTLSEAILALQKDEFASADDREACAATVITIMDKYGDSANDMVMVGILSDSAPVRREVEQIGRAALLLGGYGQHLHRQDPGTRVVVDSKSPLAKLHESLMPACNEQFYDFFVTLLKSSILLRLFKMKTLEEEVVVLTEKMLLSIANRGMGFRQFVSEYAEGRPMGKAMITEARRHFEWYASNHVGKDDEWQLYYMDRLHGCNHYMQLKMVGEQENPAFECFRDIVHEFIPSERKAVYTENCVIAGAETKRELADILNFVLEAADQTGLQLLFEAKDLDLPSVVIQGFEFSATGIVRCSR